MLWDKEKGEYYCWRNVYPTVHICKPATKHQSVYYAVKKTKQKDVLRDEHHRLKEGRGGGKGGKQHETVSLCILNNLSDYITMYTVLCTPD